LPLPTLKISGNLVPFDGIHAFTFSPKFGNLGTPEPYELRVPIPLLASVIDANSTDIAESFLSSAHQLGPDFILQCLLANIRDLLKLNHSTPTWTLAGFESAEVFDDMLVIKGDTNSLRQETHIPDASRNVN
jgi:hypothetical protein